MSGYLLKRLALLPLTLLVILLVNFVILSLAPGDPSSVSTAAVSGDGMRQAGQESELNRDDQYLTFREHYGLTLPIVFNLWPATSEHTVLRALHKLSDRTTMSARRYTEFRTRFGDRARYIMPQLLAIAADQTQPQAIRKMAVRYFLRGGTRMGKIGPNATGEQRAYNRRVAADNTALREIVTAADSLDAKVATLQTWYALNRAYYGYEPNIGQRIRTFFFDTRLSRYFGRMARFDFGTLRNDHNRRVVTEVAKRFKVSLALAVIPMLLTFALCQFFGFLMACKQKRWPDYGLNVMFLVLYAVPIFVVAPFLIEKIALPHGLPVGGFHSDDAVYAQMTSWQRLKDVGQHLALPLLAVMYGTLAVQARLSRTAVLEVMRQDYVRTAHAKGVPPTTVLVKHVGRNASITIVTALAASLGAILGGSLIVETIFGIDGFGKFFYDAISGRDYNVILFSTFASALLALVGYLLADLAYTFLDPRVTLK